MVDRLLRKRVSIIHGVLSENVQVFDLKRQVDLILCEWLVKSVVEHAKLNLNAARRTAKEAKFRAAWRALSSRLSHAQDAGEEKYRGGHFTDA